MSIGLPHFRGRGGGRPRWLQVQTGSEVCAGLVSDSIPVISVFSVKWEAKLSSQWKEVESACWVRSLLQLCLAGTPAGGHGLGSWAGSSRVEVFLCGRDARTRKVLTAEEGFQGGFCGMEGLWLMGRENMEWSMARPMQGLGMGWWVAA